MNTATQCPGTMAMSVTSTDELIPAAPQQAATDPSEGIGHANLRRAVHARVFGASEPVRVGRYTVLERVGSGAMAVVYAAYDNELDRKIAVKVLRVERAIPRERLLREAKALARLSHPNVVHVYEVGEHEGEVFMAMELVHGTMLGEWLDQAPRSWRQVVEVFVEAARGLAAAHAQGVVHRDFKPDNMLVGEDGRVRVVDFGLAIDEPSLSGTESIPATLSSVPLFPGLTQTGATLGTPGYMAPEQMDGAPVDPRVDQFSLCVALYEALAGERPFDGLTLLDIRRHIADAIPSWPASTRSIPATLKQAIARGLSEAPQQRHTSMDALIDALHRATRKSRWRVLGASGMGTAAILAGGLWWTGAGADRPVADASTALAAVADTPSPEPQDALVLEQARNLLSIDPTAAVERLASLSDDANAWAEAAWALAAEAEVRGLAYRSVELPEGSTALASLGMRVLVIDKKSCELRVQDPDGEVWWRHSADCDEYVYTDGRPANITLAGHHVVFIDRGIVTVADLERRVVRSLGVERVLYDKLAVAPSGTVVLAQERQLMVWGPDAVEPTTSSFLAPEDISQLKVSADGRTVVAALQSKTLEIRHLPTDMARSLSETVFQIAIADDGEQLIARRTDGALVRWRLGVDEVEVLDQALPDCIPMAISGDGQHLIAIEPTSGVLSWNLEEHRREGWVDAENPRVAALSPDGERVAFIDEGVVKIATIDGQVLRTLQQRKPIDRFEWADHQIVTSVRGHHIRYWNVPQAITMQPGHRGEIESLAFVPSRSMLLSAGVDRTVRRWDLGTGRDTILGNTRDVPLSIQASSDGRYAVASLHGGQLLAWDLETDAMMVGPQSQGSLGSAHEVFFGGSGGINAWDLRTGSQYTVIPTDSDCRLLDAISTGWAVAACDHDEESTEMRIWSRDRPDPIFVAPSHRFDLAELDPSGQHMIHMDLQIRPLFKVMSLADQTTVAMEHRDIAYSFTFDPTGERLIGRDGSELRQWRTTTGNSRLLPGIDASEVDAVAYAPDGIRFAIGTSEGRIFLSDDPVPTEGTALRAWVRNAVPERLVMGGPTP